MDVGLVLQGGGALGAYEWGIVARLVEAGIKPVAIAGVSIGAINTAAIAGARNGDIVASLDALWSAITLPSIPWLPQVAQAELSLFGNPNFFSPRMDYWAAASWPSFYSVAPMLATLDEIVDFDRLNDTRLHKVAVTATRVEDGRPVAFSNLAGPPYENQGKPLDARHILASGSLPPGFPMSEIEGKHYIDGGVFSNTPLPRLLAMLDDRQLDTMPIFVIDLFPESDGIPATIAQAQNRMKEITYENRISAGFGGPEGLRAHGEMIRKLAGTIKADPSIANSAEAKRLLRERAFANIHVIEAANAPFSGDHDFSSAGVMERRERGRTAAEIWLKANRTLTAA
ncbi:MAG: patatin-like phospholipase family protein [Rhodobacteraceae bacterium]|nr:patatin-like phospholipase family protein [Paracoccaceae bacterium]